MTLIVDPGFHMWFALALTGLAIVLFVRERVPLEVTSVLILTTLLLFGQVFPLLDANGNNLLDSMNLLAGFSNPSLIAVLALLIMGQAMIHTDALRVVSRTFKSIPRNMAWLTIALMLGLIAVISAFMNNTPLVVIAIPLLQGLAHSMGMSESRIMIPLSYAAILGGMTTLIGSSTNLLVTSAMSELGYEPLKFFDFIVPGAMLASLGMIYVIFILPRLLPDRSTMVQELAGNKKEFIAEFDINKDSNLVGLECVEGRFPALEDLNVKLIQRGGHLILPPFEGYRIEVGDVLIVSATHRALTNIFTKYPGFLLAQENEEAVFSVPEEDDETIPVPASGTETKILAEIMITPASRMVDMSLDHVGFHRQFSTIVLGIQRRAKVVRRRLGRIRLEPGDVLLVAGTSGTIDSLRDNSDFIVLSGSKRDLPVPAKAPIAWGIFITTIMLAAADVISIPVAAITGSVIMIATGCLNIRQATRAFDRKIFLLVGSMLALGSALQITGGAVFLANQILEIPFIDTPLMLLSALFILIAFTTNVLTNNACAILFTPIALNLAGTVQITQALDYDVASIFAIAVIFAANCSFASPIGYQTNLLVMGPGHYRFSDFIKGGVPLIILLWLGFMLVCKYYYGLS